MNLNMQNGVISTINFVPYFEIDEYQDLRNSLFNQAKLVSDFSPNKHIDVFDETILVFENYSHALSFLINVFRIAVKLKELSGINFSLKSSLCGGEYFLQDDQIYGDAVNLATKLTCSSRENELLICGIDKPIIDKFIDDQDDVSYFVRSQVEDCISIGLLDQDITETKAENKILQLRYNNQSMDFGNSRRHKINIGRSDNSDISIDSDHISRHHATITLNHDKIFIADHSTNGTYVYIDNREISLANESMQLVSDGYIVCGRTIPSKKSSSNAISYLLWGGNSVDSQEVA
jgi:adenylate cyclase